MGRTGADTEGQWRSIGDLTDWLRQAPAGTSLDAHGLHEALADLAETEPDPQPLELVPEPAPGWRERLWACPAETRLNVSELAEALGKSASWIYKRTAVGADARLPHRKLDGSLAFTAGEIRAWIRSNEDEIHGIPMEVAA